MGMGQKSLMGKATQSGRNTQAYNIRHLAPSETFGF